MSEPRSECQRRRDVVEFLEMGGETLRQRVMAVKNAVEARVVTIEYAEGVLGQCRKWIDEWTACGEPQRAPSNGGGTDEEKRLRDAVRWRILRQERPEHGKPYLVMCVNGAVHYAWARRREYLGGEIEVGFDVNDVTHWLPFPPVGSTG